MTRRTWLPVTLVGLAAALWMVHLTDLSIAGSRMDALVPVLLLPLGVLLWRRFRTVTGSRVTLAACGLLIGGSLLPVLAAVLLAIPPFTLAGAFAAGEFASEERVQSVSSPTGKWSARVYHRGVGAYAAGWGRLRVSVAHRYFPFVERDVYYIPVSYWEEPRAEYVVWSDENRLVALETSDTVTIGRVRLDAPWFVETPASLLRAIRGIQRSAETLRRDDPLSNSAI